MDSKTNLDSSNENKSNFKFTDNNEDNSNVTNSQSSIKRVSTLKIPISKLSSKEIDEEGDEYKNKESNLIEEQKIAINLFQWLILYCGNDNNFLSIIINYFYLKYSKSTTKNGTRSRPEYYNK